MSKRSSSTDMVARAKNKAVSCSTPERYGGESPSRDSDSIYDSDAASPVPFLCTQDGAEGETDVVWNFYTPKSETGASRCKVKTPMSKKGRKNKQTSIDKSVAKPKPIKQTQKSNELFQELFELKKNVHEYMSKKPLCNFDKPQSEEDIFSDNSDSSPKSGLRSGSRCLRKNVLSSKFCKPESENGLESDDSMNECLLKASQAIEENIINSGPTKPKRPCLQKLKECKSKNVKVKIANDSMDAILSNIKLESPGVSKIKCDSPQINNDSFDNILQNLDDSALEKLSQMPCHESKNTPVNTNKGSNRKQKDVANLDCGPVFGRHNSMPESPSTSTMNKPCTSGMGFGRYNSMPFNKSIDKGDSPIKCTPDEIEKKRKQAREKLLAKRLLPFTQQPRQKHVTLLEESFATMEPGNKMDIHKDSGISNNSDDPDDIKSIIEKKRLEALLRLRKRNHQNT